LLLRMIFYFICFLSFALVLLPWAASRLDVAFSRLALGLPLVVRVLGGALLGGALAGYTLASLHLVRRGRGAYVEFDPPQEFVASGVFRWCRNPIAACVLLMLLGEGIAFSSGGMLLLFLVALPLAHAQVVCIEEPLLRRRFGRCYEEYLAQVPRWIPRPPRNPVGSPRS